jgi:hypothetical protein
MAAVCPACRDAILYRTALLAGNTICIIHIIRIIIRLKIEMYFVGTRGGYYVKKDG